MKRLGLLGDISGSAAAEMALITPLILMLMVGSFELGNLFLDQHTLEKQVQDGARFASRLEIAKTYSCPGTVYQDVNATTQIIKVTKDETVTGSGNARWGTYWTRTCTGDTQTVQVSLRCVPKTALDSGSSGFTGIYTGLNGDIPVVKVAAAVKYRSVLAALGFNAGNICLKAESEAAVQGL
jgi:hypothetical protein